MPERLLTGACRRVRARLSRALESERGSFLVEIVVSAALIGVVTIAVFAMFDGANAASGRNKARSVANSLAEQDQERLRAMPVGTSGTVNQTSTKTLDGVQYTVVSRGQWITESTGANVSCTGAGKADYVKISSTVSWPNMRLSKPIEQDSIVSPGPGTGGLGVAAKQRDGITALAGLPVALSGPQALNNTTDAAGCAFFGSLGTGNYGIAASLPGYTTTAWNVDPADGISPTGTAIGDTFTPTPGSTTVKSYLYDKAATVNVTVNTKLWDGTIQTGENTDHVMFENPNAGFTGSVLLGKTGVQKTSYSPGNVFPFTDAYSVYSGDCLAENPKKYGVPAADQQTVITDPGQTYSIAVREPAMNILVKSGASLVSGGTVKVSPDNSTGAMSGCSTSFIFTTNSSGLLPNPAVPYGQWTVCADDGSLGNRKITRSIANTNPNGLAAPGGTPTTLFDTQAAGSVKGSC
jgi:Tfp pilus assembly protein PilE